MAAADDDLFAVDPAGDAVGDDIADLGVLCFCCCIRYRCAFRSKSAQVAGEISLDRRVTAAVEGIEGKLLLPQLRHAPRPVVPDCSTGRRKNQAAGKKLMKRGASGPARNEIPGKKLFFLKKTIDFARQRLYNTFLHEVTTVTVVSSKEV